MIILNSEIGRQRCQQYNILSPSKIQFKNSLASTKTEPIIPGWFFESAIVIEPERIEF